MSLGQAIGSGLALIGVVVIVAHGDLSALLRLDVNAGELWIVASALCWGLYTVLLRRAKFEVARLPLLVLLLGAASRHGAALLSLGIRRRHAFRHWTANGLHRRLPMSPSRAGR